MTVPPRTPWWPLGAVLVAFFAVFHGYSHGTALPELADPWPYAVGFMLFLTVERPFLQLRQRLLH